MVGYPNADILVSFPDIIMSKVSPRLFNKEIGLILIGRFVGEILLQIGHLDLRKPFSENTIADPKREQFPVDHLVENFSKLFGCD